MVYGILQLHFNRKKVTLDGLNGFIPGEKYTNLLTVEQELGKVLTASLEWSTSAFIHKLIPGPDIQIEKIEINYMSHIEKKYKIFKFLIN